MTKLRAPESIEDAITQSIALLGAGAISDALGVSESLIGKWSDPDDQAHRIGLHQALSLETLLVKTGHAPIFAELFDQIKPPAAYAAEPVDPVHSAMRATIDAAHLMEKVAVARKDGVYTAQEVMDLRAAITALQKGIAKFRRGLSVTPPQTRATAAKGARK